MDERLHIFGIRHHGPGSAASLVLALDDLAPDMVLIEGPPEATSIMPLAAASGMRTPVAVLTYPAKSPEEARFHPFAVFSPEWQAMLWAMRNERPMRFIDAPALARPTEDDGPPTDEDTDEDDSNAGTDGAVLDDDRAQHLTRDPLAHLAAAAGHSDGEAWWGSLIEEHVHAPDVFRAIERAMTALRNAAAQEKPHDPDDEAEHNENERREAHMRLAIRKALKEVEGSVAVVCGAWHVPALRRKVAIKTDRATISGYKAAKAASCWVPWTDTRLARASGYGAGVVSPAWYRHLWTRFGQASDATESIASWQARAAHLLRDEGLGASTASVIEATRLAMTLAAVRGLPAPGLTELRDASRATLCHGGDLPLALIEQRLVIGETVGEVDERAPQPPLLADLTRLQRRLRLKPEALERDIALDLRSQAGLAKSTLLHRLILLGVHWGTLTDAQAGRGTFRELWRIEWRPELSVALAEAVVHGPTVEQAAAAAAAAKGHDTADCGELATLVQQCLLADLPDAAELNIRALQDAATSAASVFVLAKAVRPLVEVLRYGTARSMPQALLRDLVVRLSTEVCVGLRYACHGLDEEAAQSARSDLRAMDGAISLLEEERASELWIGALHQLADDSQASPLLRGYATRMLHDRGGSSPDGVALELSRALSASVPPLESGLWFEGFINESGEILLLDGQLFEMIDDWLLAQSEEGFIELLPMLRRSFSTLDGISVRRIIEQVRSGSPTGTVVVTVDPRADAAFEVALPLLKCILGVATDE